MLVYGHTSLTFFTKIHNASLWSHKLDLLYQKHRIHKNWTCRLLFRVVLPSGPAMEHFQLGSYTSAWSGSSAAWLPWSLCWVRAPPLCLWGSSHASKLQQWCHHSTVACQPDGFAGLGTGLIAFKSLSCLKQMNPKLSHKLEIGK